MEARTERAPRELTHPVRVGDVVVGGGAPVSVQSMCTTDTADAASTLAQIGRLAEAGCEIVRVAIPSAAALDGFGEVCAASPLPVVADIHFDHRLAIEACRRGAAALRVNPGNIGSWERVDAVIDEAGAAGIPIRIGVNAGSLDPAFAERDDLTHVEKLVGSATSFVEHFRARGFADIVLSAKAHGVPTTVEVNRALARELPDVPLHIGVTEAGTLRQGTVKNAAAVGALLMEGIGDTIRLSLTADPVEEVNVAWDLLSAVGLRRLRPELVSCPTCGRCQWDLMGGRRRGRAPARGRAGSHHRGGHGLRGKRPRRGQGRRHRARGRPRQGRALRPGREDPHRQRGRRRGRALRRDRATLLVEPRDSPSFSPVLLAAHVPAVAASVRVSYD